MAAVSRSPPVSLCHSVHKIGCLASGFGCATVGGRTDNRQTTNKRILEKEKALTRDLDAARGDAQTPAGGATGFPMEKDTVAPTGSLSSLRFGCGESPTRGGRRGSRPSTINRALSVPQAIDAQRR